MEDLYDRQEEERLIEMIDTWLPGFKDDLLNKEPELTHEYYDLNDYDEKMSKPKNNENSIEDFLESLSNSLHKIEEERKLRKERIKCYKRNFKLFANPDPVVRLFARVNIEFASKDLPSKIAQSKEYTDTGIIFHKIKKVDDEFD